MKVGSCRHWECLAVRGGRFIPITFPALSALVLHPTRGPILFDTGYAEHFCAATHEFPERLYRWITPMRLPKHQTLTVQLARYGLKPSDVRACVVSHFHADHVAGLRDLPAARILASNSALLTMTNRGRLRALANGVLPQLLPDDFAARFSDVESCTKVELPRPWHALGHGFDLLGDGSLLGALMPGHSPGHLGLLVRDQDSRDVFLAADSSWSLRAVREDLPPSVLVRPIMHEWRQYRSTLRRLHELLTCHPELVVLPSHCDTSLSRYDPAWSEQ